MITSERIFIVAGAVLSVLMQVLVAPHIALFGGMAFPNVIVVFTMLVAVTRPAQFNPILPFVLGLVFDLISGGPVGAMAFSLTVFSVVTALFVSRMSNDTSFVEIISLAIGLLLVELSYGVFLMLFGYPVDFFGALAYRVVPCFLYDFFLGAVLYPLVSRFLKTSNAQLMGFGQLR